MLAEWRLYLSVREHWSGDDWEEYAKQLLVIRYGVGFQPVFDRDRGDWGIEGYVSADAVVVQCYAAQEPRNASDLYEKQRDKMTADLGKLVENRAAVSKALGCRIKMWVLLVPDCDSKRILEHAGRKQAELRKCAYAEVDDDFVIRVLTHREFESEKAQLNAELLLLPIVEVQDDGLSEVPLLEELRGKADVLTSGDRDVLVDSFVQHYMRGQSLLQRIKTNYPQVWTDIDLAVRSRERGLATTSLLDGEGHPPLPSLVEDVEARVASAAPSLSDGHALDIAWGTLADWLIRCPLDPRTSK